MVCLPDLILAHLVDEYDGLYTPYLITKTGKLGDYLLDNELFIGAKLERDRHLMRKRLRRHIVARDGEPRCTTWNEPDGDYDTRDPIPPEQELSRADLEGDTSIAKALDEASLVFLASLETPHFTEILEYLLDPASASTLRPLSNSRKRTYPNGSRPASSSHGA